MNPHRIVLVRSLAAAAAILFAFVPSLMANEPTAAKPDEPAAAKTAEAAAPKAGGAVRVAVLDFDADAPGQPGLGAELAELVAIRLSGVPEIETVERTTLCRVLEEHSLSLSGLVDEQQAVKVGQLVGAQVLVVGRVFASGDDTIAAARLIGVETTRMKGATLTATENESQAALVLRLADGLAELLAKSSGELLPKPIDRAAELAALKEQLGKKKLPVIAVNIPERHLTHAAPTPDPAAETEMKHLLLDCGFTVRDAKSPATPNAEPADEAGPALRSVEVLIKGEGLSEYAARLGNLQTCTARVEVKVVDRASGKVLLSDSETARGVDLSENIAAKTALQTAGRALGLRIAQHFAESAETGG